MAKHYEATLLKSILSRLSLEIPYILLSYSIIVCSFAQDFYFSFLLQKWFTRSVPQVGYFVDERKYG